MESPAKGVYWGKQEVRLMLTCLVEQGAGERVMRSTNLETLSIFTLVAEYLAERGHHRTPLQARAKFKLEKACFYAHLEENQGDQSGAPEGSRMRLLHELWVQGGRPSWQSRLREGEWCFVSF